ncbi:MAG: RNA methyltransferase [Candidatus Bathyarchaeota archaeon]|nr:RNA methyltransferase [Candidatus Bathyarchaeota archaeon]
MKRHPRLSVAIPASLVSDIPHLREKTLKIGLIGRALAIFRVDELVIFPDLQDRNQRRETELITLILSYMETPQYLRKRLFKIRPELRYAGVLPPLRTPHHPLRNQKKDLKIGEYREAVVVSAAQKRLHVDIGVEQPVSVPDAQIPVNNRVTVKIVKDGKRLKAELADPHEIEAYWGYEVTVSKIPFGRMLKKSPRGLVIATSRRGDPFMNVAHDLVAEWKRSESILVAFGSPTQGLQGIVKQERLELKEIVDFVVNTIPDQAPETVRTEEALYATLAALNLLTATA